MKQRLPAILTILLIVSAFVGLTQRERLWKLIRPEETTRGPEELVWRTSDAARRGDVRSYLDCFGDRLRDRLERTAAEMGEAQFSDYLTRLNQELTGIAVSDLERPNDQIATLRVEFVYRGKNEVQKHEFKLVNGSWKIVGVGDAEWLKGLLPWGTDASGKE